MEGDEIIAGTFNKTIIKIDTRCEKPVAMNKVHSKAVLCMQRTSKWIITGSESKIMNIIDAKTLQVCNTAKLTVGYPRSMSLHGSQLYVGSSKGTIHIFSFNDQLGSLALVETFDAHQLEVRSVKQTKGSVLTASKDGVCKIWQPSSQPANMCDVRPHNEQQEICTMDYVNGTLVFGTGDGYVSLFRIDDSCKEGIFTC